MVTFWPVTNSESKRIIDTQEADEQDPHKNEVIEQE